MLGSLGRGRYDHCCRIVIVIIIIICGNQTILHNFDLNNLLQITIVEHSEGSVATD